MSKALFFIFISMVTCHAEAAPLNHFFDSEGQALSELEPIWMGLYQFYKDKTPLKIIVTKKSFPDGTSKFNCKNNLVAINPKAFESEKASELIAHESSHLALCNLTQSVNLLEESRFWDEGFATIMQQRINGDLSAYKKRTLRIASIQLDSSNLSFEKVKSWKAYSRDWNGKINTYAYAVGSSFLFYIIDAYGEKRLKDFFVEVGATGNFAMTITKVFSMSSESFELQWQEYLKNQSSSKKDALAKTP